jgi:3-oxoacyl-[acyl-carrier-protein] synthase III
MTHNTNFGVGVIGTGKYIPSKLLHNKDIELSADLPLNSIKEKTGIEKRYVATSKETASSMASFAAIEAIKSANINIEDIGLIICATFTGDYRYPALACKIQKDIGAKNAGAFDIMANCTGFQVALSVASEKMLFNSEIKFTLVVGAALQSRFINWSDSDSSIYFGDGCGAAILGHVPNGYGILSTDIYSNSSAYEAVRLRGGGSSYPMSENNNNPKLDYYEINGLEVWKQLMKHQPTSIKSALKKANIDIKDVKLFLFHQANLRLIEYLMAKMKLPMNKTFTNIEKYGNTADASIAIVMSEAFEQKKIKRNDIVVVSGVGAGFTFGTSVFRWY